MTTFAQSSNYLKQAVSNVQKYTTKGKKGCLIIAWDHGGVNAYGSSNMKEIYEKYKQEFKISAMNDTKLLQDEDQLDQIAPRKGEKIMSEFYSSNEVCNVL